MYPPAANYNGFDIEALSGICGSISIACWVVVFSPQIIENFRRSSADGLSVEFVIIWLAGDVFNILGSVLQGVLPTMIILAIYYTLADIVLLGQCFYYRGFTLRDPRPEKNNAVDDSEPTEESPLLQEAGSLRPGHVEVGIAKPLTAADADRSRTRSVSSFRERLASLDPTHFSPVTPLHPQHHDVTATDVIKSSQPRSWLQAIMFNSTAIVMVIAAGIAGYYLSPSAPESRSSDGKTEADSQASTLHFNLMGQIFGYVCAVLYLGSRIPQLLLNYRRQSTDGLNALFFLFACIGNLTYVLSIFAFEPICSRHRHGHWHESHCRPGEARQVYGKYILINLSWLVGSLGTLFLDAGVFVQFFLYRNNAAPSTGVREAAPLRRNTDDRGREP
ncbi:hypothetical protein B0A48_00639 [Cryoendolithus antarcticus]|uniref:PQ-loop-domain-containing protein n=1 Tax=Cryoendolithus antarcticus TaxID=1507870 RepID=A0A1V8TV97_9PEZI|nr:hypothetical protein B0A48_00639 [Cryoendolithus antarcticus]